MRRLFSYFDTGAAVHIYIYIHTYIHTYICVYIEREYMCVRVRACVCVYVCVSKLMVGVYVCVCVCICIQNKINKSINRSTREFCGDENALKRP